MSARRTREGAEGALDDREQEILRSIIRQHVITGEPIGSRAVRRGSRLDLSPASIRGIMAALERRGLLSQPHTSAGRIPTDRAYRLYVDQMIGRPRMSEPQRLAIEQTVLSSRGEMAELLAQLSRQLSRLSNQVGVVLAPRLSRIAVEQVEFVRLSPRRIVAILVGSSGVVQNRMIELDAPEQPQLDRIGRYLSEEFRGHTLAEIRDVLRRRMQEERARYDRLMAESLELGQRAVESASTDDSLFIEGASNLLSSPEFANPETIRGLMRTLEEKRTLIDLLGRLLEDHGVQVVIGEESRSLDLAQCSVVASSYRSRNRVVGTVGIVGPTRMEYARVIALVDYVAQVLTRFFSREEN